MAGNYNAVNGANSSQKVKVTHVIDLHNFYAQIGSEECLSFFDRKEAELEEFCLRQMQVLAPDLAEGQRVVVRSATYDCWLRATVKMISAGSEEPEVDVYFIDRGLTEFVSLEDICCNVPKDFSEPSTISFCRLAGIRPIAKTFVSRAISRFCELVQNKVLNVQLLSVENGQNVIDILIQDDSCGFVSLSEKMVEEGLGLPVPISGDMEKKNPDESGRKKIPAFNLQDLQRLPTPELVDQKQVEEEPEVDPEVEIFRERLGGAGEGSQYGNWGGYGCGERRTRRPKHKHLRFTQSYVKSDLTIGKDYQPNSSHDTLTSIEDQIREFSRNRPDSAKLTGASGSGEGMARGSVSPVRNNPLRDYPKRNGSPKGRGKALKEYPGNKFPNRRDSSQDSSQDSSPSSPNRSPVQGRQRVRGPRITIPNKQLDVDQMLKTPNFLPQEPQFPGRSSVSAGQIPDRAKENVKENLQGSFSSEQIIAGENPGRKGSVETIATTNENRASRNGILEEGGSSHESESSQEDLRPKAQLDPKPSGRKFGPRVGKKRTEAQRKKLENEYEWQKSKLVRKVKELVQRTSVNNVLESMEELKDLARPAHSNLADLPGPGDCPVVIDTLIDLYVEKPESIGLLVCFLEGFSSEPDFSTLISELLWKHQQNHVKVSTSSVNVRRCQGYCKLLGKLFIQSRDWMDETSESISFCVLSTLRKWSVYDMKGHRVSDQLELFMQCLVHVLREAGAEMEKTDPQAMKQIFSDIRERQLQTELPKEMRSMLMELMLERAQKWIAPEIASSDKTDADEQVGTCDVGIEVIVDLKDASTEVQTQIQEVGVQTSQTEDLGDVGNPGAASQMEAGPYSRVEQMEAGPYSRVEQMLADLHLQELQPMFVENAIRDSVLEVDFLDLKELLKECGLKPGHILEIKTYLAKPRPLKAPAINPEPTVKKIGLLSTSCKPATPHQREEAKIISTSSPPCTSVGDFFVKENNAVLPPSGNICHSNSSIVPSARLKLDEAMCTKRMGNHRNSGVPDFVGKSTENDSVTLETSWRQKSDIKIPQKGILEKETVEHSWRQKSDITTPPNETVEKETLEHSWRQKSDITIPPNGIVEKETLEHSWRQKSDITIPPNGIVEKETLEHSGRQKSDVTTPQVEIVEIAKGPRKRYPAEAVKSVVKGWLGSDVGDIPKRKQGSIRFSGSLGSSNHGYIRNKPAAEPEEAYSKPCLSPGSYSQAVSGDRSAVSVGRNHDYEKSDVSGISQSALKTETHWGGHPGQSRSSPQADKGIPVPSIPDFPATDKRWVPGRRKCTLCGDTSHLIYDCPERNKMYLIF